MSVLDKFPELSSFGTLLNFAQALEQTVESFALEAAQREDCVSFKEKLEATAKRHQKRNKKLGRLRQEQLNEVVLQPLEGMNRADYLPKEGLPPEGNTKETIEVITQAEEVISRFYLDAASIAENVLGGLPRTFKKQAEQSLEIAAELKKDPNLPYEPSCNK